jgi:hypothetical protein
VAVEVLLRASPGVGLGRTPPRRGQLRMEHPARKSGGERVNTQPINDERLSDPLHIRSRLMAHAALYPDAIFQLKPDWTG